MRLESDVAPLAEDDVCERITISFNSTHRKYNMVEERIINKLDDIHEEQKTNLKQIMDKRNCNAAVVALTAATADVSPGSVTSVKEKISSLEVELQKYENQQKTLQEKNEKLLKMLKDVNTKLSSHQGEFEKFENDLRSVVENANKAVAKEKDIKQSTIPMGVVLALTQNQKKTK
uniref:IncA protein n=1 Tax=Musca domestica TaxID=7370 RepID=T1PDT4_MUSDO